MKLTIRATRVTTRIDGVQVRMWEGTTESGVRCKVFVHRVVARDGQEAEFERELIEQLPPAESVIPLAEALSTSAFLG
jgi:hypothetical protein